MGMFEPPLFAHFLPTDDDQVVIHQLFVSDREKRSALQSGPKMRERPCDDGFRNNIPPPQPAPAINNETVLKPALGAKKCAL